jgi:hypothetical protein
VIKSVRTFPLTKICYLGPGNCQECGYTEKVGLFLARFLLSQHIYSATYESLGPKQSGRGDHRNIRFQKVRLNHQRDNMHDIPAPAILPLDSTPDGVIDGNPSSSAATAKTGIAEVIILLSPAKSSHESPSGTGTDNSVALRQQRECRRLKKGRKP